MLCTMQCCDSGDVKKLSAFEDSAVEEFKCDVNRIFCRRYYNV